MEFTREELTKNNIYYLSTLPDELEFKFSNLKVKFVHKNPYEDESDIEEDILVCGYDHVCLENKISKNKYIVNPGSLGKPSYSNEFVILDISESVYNFKIFNVDYSFPKIQKDMKMMNFPEILINSYEKNVD